MPVEVKLNNPAPELVKAFHGFISSSPGYEVLQEDEYPPSPMGGSGYIRYELSNGVVVERCKDPVVRGTLIQFSVRLPSGEYHCFFKEVERSS